MTSATVETFVIADVTGEFTGDAGDVIWTAYTTNDKTAPSASRCYSSNSRDFMTFRGFTVVGGGSTGASGMYCNSASTNHKFEQITFLISVAQTGMLYFDIAANVSAGHVVDRCIFVSFTTGNMRSLDILPATSGSADYDIGVTVKNCKFISHSAQTSNIDFVPSGALSFKPGGLRVDNCTFFGGARGVQTAANSSTSIPCLVYNSVFMGHSTGDLVANASGQITENYNLFYSATPRTNVTAGANSRAVSPPSDYAPLFEVGQSFFTGRNPRPFLSLLPSSPLLGWGAQVGGPSTDILGLARSAGSILKGDNGIVSSATDLTLTDTSKLFPSGEFKGYSVRILTGIGSGQVKTINDNNTGTLNVDGFWNPTPTVDSTYLVYAGATATMGQTTSGGALSNTRIEDANAKWGTNQWLGYTIGFASGAGASGEFISSVVSGSTATIITATSSFARNPASGDSYQLYKGSGVFFVNPSVGCYERGNTAVKETGTVRTAGTGIRIQGPGVQDFDIPVDFSATTVSVYGRYDTEYSGVLPQLIIGNGEECGVSPSSGTMTVGANTWEQLSLIVNPSGKGVITARLQSNSVTPAGATFWDDFATF